MLYLICPSNVKNGEHTISSTSVNHSSSAAADFVETFSCVPFKFLSALTHPDTSGHELQQFQYESRENGFSMFPEYAHEQSLVVAA
jgi:hypothetical protein